MDDILPILIGSTLTIAAYPLLRIGYRVAPYFKNVSRLIKPGGYVLVTGATDGIGYEFVKQLSARGVKVIALGRNQAKLDKIKDKQFKFYLIGPGNDLDYYKKIIEEKSLTNFFEIG